VVTLLRTQVKMLAPDSRLSKLDDAPSCIGEEAKYRSRQLKVSKESLPATCNMKRNMCVSFFLLVFAAFAMDSTCGMWISSDRVRDLDSAPILGRGYSIITNSFLSQCLEVNTTSSPSFDYDYSFALASPDDGERQLEIKLNRFSDSFSHSVVQKVAESTKEEMKKGEGEMKEYTLLGSMKIDRYYSSILESSARMSDDVSKLLEIEDYIGFFKSCGTTFIRSIRRSQEVIVTYKFKSCDPTLAGQFAQSIQRHSYGGLLDENGSFDQSIVRVQDDNEDEIEGECDQKTITDILRTLTISIQAFGLGLSNQAEGNSSTLVITDLLEVNDVMRDAYRAMTRKDDNADDTAGKVHSVEAFYWTNNPTFQIASKINEHSIVRVTPLDQIPKAIGGSCRSGQMIEDSFEYCCRKSEQIDVSDDSKLCQPSQFLPAPMLKNNVEANGAFVALMDDLTKSNINDLTVLKDCEIHLKEVGSRDLFRYLEPAKPTGQRITVKELLMIVDPTSESDLTNLVAEEFSEYQRMFNDKCYNALYSGSDNSDDPNAVTMAAKYFFAATYREHEECSVTSCLLPGMRWDRDSVEGRCVPGILRNGPSLTDGTYCITRVKVWNRTNDDMDRIIGFVLTIHLNGNEIWSSTSSAINTSVSAASYEFPIDDCVHGDEVIVTLHGDNKILSLAEVEVFDSSIHNIARLPDATASQSSTSSDGLAERAIDGNTSEGSVTSTDTESNPFWKLEWSGTEAKSCFKVYDQATRVVKCRYPQQDMRILQKQVKKCWASTSQSDGPGFSISPISIMTNFCKSGLNMEEDEAGEDERWRLREVERSCPGYHRSCEESSDCQTNHDLDDHYFCFKDSKTCEPGDKKIGTCEPGDKKIGTCEPGDKKERERCLSDESCAEHETLTYCHIGSVKNKCTRQPNAPQQITGWRLYWKKDDIRSQTVDMDGRIPYNCERIKFHSEEGCTDGSEIEVLSVAEILASGFNVRDNLYKPENAFNDVDAFWGGRANSDGEFFIGFRDLEINSLVKCISIQQNASQSPTHMKVQFTEDNINWITAFTDHPPKIDDFEINVTIPESRPGSSVWRIVNRDDNINTGGNWYVRTLEFYDNPECAGNKLVNGTSVASSKPETEKAAFDSDVNTHWVGHPDGNGDIWIGLDFGARVDVQCAIFIDSNSDDSDERKSKKVKLQKHIGKSSSWTDVLSFDQDFHPMPLDSTTTSNKWRVFDSDYKQHPHDDWDISRLEFYESFDCSGTKLSGTDINSDDANVDNGKSLDGRWFGQQFYSHVWVGCVIFKDAYPRINKFSVQALEESGWKTVRDLHNLPSKVLSPIPLSFPEYHAWRIVNRDNDITTGDSWDVRTLDFYDNPECAGNKLVNGTSVASSGSELTFDGNVETEIVKAFDGSLETHWSGSSDRSGEIWIGLDFGATVDVQCAIIVDGFSDDSDERKSKKVTLQKQMWSWSSWIDVLSFEKDFHPMPPDSTIMSNEWRVFDSDYEQNPHDDWDISRLEFYESFDCSGTKLSGTHVESGNADGEKHPPQSAFDGDDGTYWSGRHDDFGSHWLGQKYATDVQVGCVFFRENNHTAKKVLVIARHEAGWKNVLLVDNLPRGKKLSLIPLPLPAPVPLPVPPPTFLPCCPCSPCDFPPCLEEVTSSCDRSCVLLC